MVKEPLSAIFSVLVLFSISLFAFSGCQKTHTHEFGEWTIVKQATCEESGTKSVSVRDATKPNKKRLRRAGTLNDNGVFYITMVEIAEDGSETENVVEVYEWTEKTVSLRYTQTVNSPARAKSSTAISSTTI